MQPLEEKLGYTFQDKRLLENALTHSSYANEVGGTALLGISQPVIKAHGSSNGYAFFNAIRQAKVVAEGDIVGDIAANVDHMSLPRGKKEG